MDRKTQFLLNIFIIFPTVIFCGNQTIFFDDSELDFDFEKEIFKPSENSDCIRTKSTISLNLNNTGLQLIYKGFIDLSSITCLNLESNNIIVIPNGTFDNLPNLTYLNLARNNIAADNLLSFGPHKNLQTLILDGNSRNDFSGKFLSRGKFPNLKNLYIRNNRLRYLEFGDNFPNLIHLYLSGNIGGNKTYFENLPKYLNHLEMEKNNIYQFNASTLKNISSLFIGGNNFNKLGCCDDKYFHPGNSIVLKILSVSHCYITKIEVTAFKETLNLEKLDLSFNLISNISKKTFSELKNLKSLSLSHNLLNKIPKEIFPKNLKKLFLSYNKIETLDQNSLNNFTGLETLSLKGNKIHFLQEKILDNLKNLMELDLSENRLQKIYPNWIQPLQNLKCLNLNSNQLSSTEFLFLKNTLKKPLEKLYLKNNRIKKIEIESMKDFPNNLILHLGNNQNLKLDLKSVKNYCGKNE